MSRTVVNAIATGILRQPAAARWLLISMLALVNDDYARGIADALLMTTVKESY